MTSKFVNKTTGNIWPFSLNQAHHDDYERPDLDCATLLAILQVSLVLETICDVLGSIVSN